MSLTLRPRTCLYNTHAYFVLCYIVFLDGLWSFLELDSVFLQGFAQKNSGSGSADVDLLTIACAIFAYVSSVLIKDLIDTEEKRN